MFLSALASVVSGLLMADTPDTLQAVTVVADRGVVVSRADTVKINNPISITDALSGVPGLYLSDNGGAAGLKTVSLRGLGSPHTAIYIDGVRACNVQSGQTDLGMLDLGNCSSAVIDYAQNSLSFNTAKPVFGSSKAGGRVRLRGGSFGTWEPSGRLDFRLSENISLSATAGGMVSKGDFKLSDGTARTNNDIRQIRGGLDLWGNMAGGDWHAKGYLNGAERGTPGTPTWPSSDRQKDRNAFMQGVLHKQFSPLYMLTASAKAAFDDLLYMSGYGDSRYKQTEIQLNTSHKFSIRKWFDASLAADLWWDGLSSDLYNAARTSAFATATAAFHPDRFRADIALEYSGTFDKDGGKRNVLSPSVDMRWNAFDGFDISAFARRAYRTPTFNELYYPGYGNPELKAEDAWLTDAGVEYSHGFGGRWSVQAKADFFLNHLKDKIVSAPTATDPNIWLPYNVGTVQADGVDVQTRVSRSTDHLTTGFSARYSFQNAVDKTAGSYSYGQQIPYIARHAVCLGADASCKGWSAVLNWNWRGGRFDSYGRMPDYHNLDLTFGKDFKIHERQVIALKLIARNLTDCRYELATGYPMPGRAFYAEIGFSF